MSYEVFESCAAWQGSAPLEAQKALRSQELNTPPRILLRVARAWVVWTQSLRTVLAGSDLQGIKPRLDLVHPLLRAASGAAHLLPNIQ